MSSVTVFMLAVLPADSGESDLAATVSRVETGTPSLSVLDLGAARGDGVFETLGVIDGHAENVDAHLNRLARSAEMMDLPRPHLAQWRAAIAVAVAPLHGTPRASLRLVLTRGVEGAGTPTAWLVARTQPAGSADPVRVVTLNRGYPSDISQKAPWLLAGAKTLSYAVNMAALREAARRGADDVIFTTTDGFVMEGPTSSVILRRGDTFITPEIEIGILAGTTQLAAFDFLSRRGFTTAYERIKVEELATADGLWLASSVRLAAAVTELDSRPVAVDVAMTHDLGQALQGL